jgi:hypothetical protein
MIEVIMIFDLINGDLLLIILVLAQKIVKKSRSITTIMINLDADVTNIREKTIPLNKVRVH